MADIWKPHAVVAAIIEQDGRFLLVEEETDDGVMLNQPAGHLDPGETFLDAVARETLEETAHHFIADSLLGVYLWPHPIRNRTYLRFAFTGRVTGVEPGRPLDTGVVRTVWMAPDELRATRARHRSPLVLRCVDDYLAGQRYPLDLLRHLF